MIDIESEKLITLSQACKRIPSNPHISTLHRWRAWKHNPLECIRYGGRTFTSVQAIERFVIACSDPTQKPVTTKTRQRAFDKATLELEEAGI